LHGKFSFGHALPIVPVNEGTLRIHQIESMSSLFENLRNYLVLVESVDRVPRRRLQILIIFYSLTLGVRLARHNDTVFHILSPGNDLGSFDSIESILKVTLLKRRATEEHGTPKVLEGDLRLLFIFLLFFLFLLLFRVITQIVLRIKNLLCKLGSL